jgi:hypothetical protein
MILGFTVLLGVLTIFLLEMAIILFQKTIDCLPSDPRDYDYLSVIIDFKNKIS